MFIIYLYYSVSYDFPNSNGVTMKSMDKSVAVKHSKTQENVFYY